ncbi:MAG: right-handed parallel beta-helix repeat-containing protein [Chlamydiales bacterium]|nr:right-handed parallel beta-helix repeat-containing protein [Chlamydiales bacterium]
MFRLIFLALILSLSGFASASQPYRAAFRHIEGGGIGYKDGYTTLEMFMSSDEGQWDVTPFFDARSHVFNNGKWATNIGCGIRAPRGNHVYGINTYYDYRNGGRLRSNQLGLGLEALGELFDFRINGYLPVGKTTGSPYDPIFGTFSGNNLLISQKYQCAMKGTDAEVGYHFGKFESLNFYAAVGPYYFKGSVGHGAGGAKARVSCTLKDVLTLEISDSYDRTFHNKFQGQLSLNFPFGPQSNSREQKRIYYAANTLNDRMLQPVARQEIIVMDNPRKNNLAIDPATGLPLIFVFVNNTGMSNGTFESPYHSLAQAQDNSSPNNIIYVFPGDGTTAGMDSGIFLKPNQKFWGSGVSHSVLTPVGTITIPALSSSSPIITNTNIDTDGNAVTLAANNEISGFTISSALNDAIYGTDLQSLDVSYCTFKNTTTYPIEAYFSGNTSISLTNNRFLDNVNGVFLNLNGTSSVLCSNNIFRGQTSVSSTPLEIVANSNMFAASIENNLFDSNTTGSIRFNLDNAVNANINILGNTIINNGTGSQASLGSSLVVLSSGTIDNCSIALRNNIFTGNTSNSLYLHTSGAFGTLGVTASANTMSNNGGSGLVLATPANILLLTATNNVITGCSDNGIAVISSGSTAIGDITISDNIISGIGNASNGIAINQDFSALSLSISDNEIIGCEGTGIVSYAPTGIGLFILDISGNTINNCQNLSSNAASGIDIEQYSFLDASITDNTLADNTGVAVTIGSTLPNPSACVTLTDNDSSTGYLLINPVDGLFNLDPCDVDSTNVGTINTSGTITPVQSCPDAAPCPP